MRLLNLYKPFALMFFLFWVFGLDQAKAGSAVSAQTTSIDEVRDAALRHARTTIADDDARIEVGALDARLRFAACDAPLAARTASEAGNGGAMSIEVRCDTAGWKLFVPVTIRLQVPVLVAIRPLARGATVSAADIEIQIRDRATLGVAYLGSPDQLGGQVLARAIPAGSVLTAGALMPVRLVKRGQAVTLIGRSGRFQIRAQGKALGDASAGQLIRVENLSSRRVVEGEVNADGTVQVGL
ncbi:MAG: flagellar basal body P-ring formation chaperone FlgA [Panacagrimonas sp.]